MTVQRYRIDENGELRKYMYGDLVTFDDYTKLERQQVKTTGVFLLRYRNGEEYVHEYYSDAECKSLNYRLTALSQDSRASSIEVFRLVDVPLVKKTILSLPNE